MKIEYVLYFLIGVISTILCWYEIWDFVSLGFIGAWKAFLEGTQATPVTRFLNWDASSVTITFTLWVLIDTFKKKLKLGPVFIVLAFLIAISFAFPLYLIYRDYALSKENVNG